MLVSTEAVAISHNWIRRHICYFVGYESINIEMESAVRRCFPSIQFFFTFVDDTNLELSGSK